MECFSSIFPEEIRSSEWGERCEVTEPCGGTAGLQPDMFESKPYTLEPFDCSCYLIRSLVFLPEEGEIDRVGERLAFKMLGLLIV